MEEKLTVERKALLINLDQKIFGTFAEIGAGQETARNFFRVGGAAGTIAKTMSAYDMTYSDAIYGKVGRYVSRERLQTMLDREYYLLIERLSEKRGADTHFFAFANTVAAKSFKGSGESHGWLGVKFQSGPLKKPNDIIIHIRMLDKENVLQQQALGSIGVNLLYGAFYYRENPQKFIESLVDDLGNERIEIDMIEISGPDFKDIDNRRLSLYLLEKNLTHAVMFAPDGKVLQPSEALYKKPVLVERGSFKPVTHVNIDMIKAAKQQFLYEESVVGKDSVVLFEITLNNLMASGSIDEQDFLSRADCLSALGYTVLISNYSEFHRLSKFFRRYTKETVGMVLGINALLEIFNEKYCQDLEGGILESLGRLFTNNAKLYVYPMTRGAYQKYVQATNLAVLPSNIDELPDLVTLYEVALPPKIHHLYAHLRDSGLLVSIKDPNPANFNIFSRDVLEKIRKGDMTWKESVPTAAARVIEERGLFKK
jgi:hypothetical protein